MIELKSCPFCGGTPEVVFFNEDGEVFGRTEEDVMNALGIDTEEEALAMSDEDFYDALAIEYNVSAEVACRCGGKFTGWQGLNEAIEGWNRRI